LSSETALALGDVPAEPAEGRRARTEVESRAVVAVACLCLALLLPACGGTASNGPSASRLIVLDRSVGGVRLREQRVTVARSVGRGVVVRTTIDRSARPTPERITQVAYQGGALVVTYASAANQPSRVFVLETKSTRYRTRSGLGVGSSCTTMVSVGGVNCYGESTECQHGYAAVNMPGTTFRLDRPRGKVIYIAMTFGH
jgi:hypothetical protein